MSFYVYTVVTRRHTHNQKGYQIDRLFALAPCGKPEGLIVQTSENVMDSLLDDHVFRFRRRLAPWARGSEFVQAVCTFCCFCVTDMLKFCFMVYDKDRSGLMEIEELHHFIKVCHILLSCQCTRKVRISRSQSGEMFVGVMSAGRVIEMVVSRGMAAVYS